MAPSPFALWPSLLSLPVIALSWCGSVAAQALPVRAPVRLAAHAGTVSVEADGSETLIRATFGADHPEVRLPGVATGATVEVVDATSGPVLVVRTSAPDGAAVVAWARGHARLVWSGRLGLHGDAGERTADVLDLTDRTGDGRPDVVVGLSREGLGRCDGGVALLAPRALTSTGELRSVELRRGLGAEAPARAATPTTPGPTGEPLLRALRFAGATSTAGESEPLLAAPPRALTDGDATTAWAEGRPGGGDGELLAGRWESDVPIRALRLRSGGGVALPRAITLHLGAHAERVTVPDGATDAWIPFEPAIEASCVSIVIDEGAAGGTTGFSEISAYTEPDFGRGIDALVDELVAEGPHGDDVATWLGRVGAPACAALDAAWDRLGTLGRLRAMRVAGAVRDAAGAALLGRGAADEATEVREEALRLLVSRGALDVVAERAIDAGAAGDDAARALARVERPRLTSPGTVLAALEAGADRPALRLAAARVASTDAAALEAFSGASPTALAALALGLTDDGLGARGREERGALALRSIEAASAGASAFVDRYRLALAARGLASDAVDAWLAAQVTSAEEWMQRDAALEALGTRASAEVLAHALADGYPRVRVRAVSLAGARDDRAAVTAALADPWPTVRLAAVIALGDAETARAALDDRVALVRVGAIEVLTRLGDRTARGVIEARLTDRDEWPEVLRASLSYVEALCLVESGPAVASVVRRGAREDAWAPDVEVALAALAVALRLGGEAEALGVEAAGSGGASIAAFEPVLSRRDAFAHCSP